MLVNCLTLLLATLGSVASALPEGPGRPGRHDKFDLIGYGRDNPLGRTTGGEGGRTTTVSCAEALASAVADDEPRVVYVKGEIALPERLKVGSNKSILGVGRRTVITENGISVVNATNVIIRNLKISHILDNDGLTVQNSTRLWIDHNEFESDMDHGPDYYVGVMALNTCIDIGMKLTSIHLGRPMRYRKGL